MPLVYEMAKKEKKEGDDRKTVLVKKHVWKELQTIRFNEEYPSISDVVEDLLKKGKKKR